MFIGKWDTKVDEKWRLYLPPGVKKELGSSLLLKEEENNGCVVICKPDSLAKENPSDIFILTIKNAGRISIPEPFRNSTSFYFGRKVTLAGKGDHLEIWPRP